MKLSREALLVLQRMAGEEGAVFLRNLPINIRFLDADGKKREYQIPPSGRVDENAFEELKNAGCIYLHMQSHNGEQWGMTKTGEQSLKDAGMETAPGRLTRDDIQWLTGTGRYAQ